MDQRAAVELGSIAAAAFEGSAAVRAVFDAVTADVVPGPVAPEPVPEVDQPAGERWQLSTPDGDFEADPATLPTELVRALRATAPGRQVTVGPWTAALTGRQPAPAPPDRTAELLGSARRIAFVRWLDRARAERLTLVPGLEHPGDPAQPDNHHRH
ncbi:hypothetical protein ASC99_33270 [Kitasatospora sp. Root107]|nr:hypothetical protein ASC99_33270 [Kitasatospora sp. Root107]